MDLASDVGEGGPDDDFFPSRLLLSASIRVREAQMRHEDTEYPLVSRADDAIQRHPWVQEPGPTRTWCQGGRGTPGN